MACSIVWTIRSWSKAVTGTLTAIALNDGLLDRVDHPILEFFADRNIANLDDRKKTITVQNLLDMTSGFEWEEEIEGGREQSLVDSRRSPDAIKFVLDRPMGTRRARSSITTAVIHICFRRSSRNSLA